MTRVRVTGRLYILCTKAAQQTLRVTEMVSILRFLQQQLQRRLFLFKKYEKKRRLKSSSKGALTDYVQFAVENTRDNGNQSTKRWKPDTKHTHMYIVTLIYLNMCLALGKC